MKNVRVCSGEKVAEVKGTSQEVLFQELAKFAKKHFVSSISIYENRYDDGEYAIVTYT